MKNSLEQLISEHLYWPVPAAEGPREVECLCGWAGTRAGVAEHLAVAVRLWVFELVGDEEMVISWREAADEVRPFTRKWDHPADAAIIEFVLNSMNLGRGK